VNEGNKNQSDLLDKNYAGLLNSYANVSFSAYVPVGTFGW